ncbi:MAG: hypothetical protein RIE86_23970 [Imperialibacter sp.]|uniref:capsular polysaccharide export protein, LipB/KpsS family n=1 Tax=Imperialibacter sp. TaxID=2038411 RepID=UPI0032EBD0D0
MKIAVFNSHSLWASHYETELEIIQQHLEAGDEVVQMQCISELPTCDQNLNYAVDSCQRCIKKVEQGRSLLSKKITSVGIDRYLNKSDWDRIINLPSGFKTVQELKEFTIEDFDIGQGVASSIISLLRHSNFDLELHKDLLKNYLDGSAKVYFAFKSFIKQEVPDVVYCFNGRWAHTRAVFRACENSGVTCILHERGQDILHYALFKNSFPHSIAKFTVRANALWADAGPGKSELAAMFFENRKNGNSDDWYSFIKKQKNSVFPAGWDETKLNVVIFNSSEDEVAAIDDEWKNEVYTDQIQGIQSICESLKGDRSIQIYLRIHPNVAKAHPGEYTPYAKLTYNNLTIIGPDSEISTYGLLEKADKVITFGSTVGIEAVYWSKPSILAGKAFYQDLQGTYNPKSHEELLELLRRPLEPLPKEAALIYGYYFRSFGEPFIHTKAESFSQASFKGVDIDKASERDFLFRLLSRFGKINSAASWLHRRINLIKLFRLK